MCNFRCKYCFENGDGRSYTPTKISIKHLNRFANYIMYLRRQKDFSNAYFAVPIYGGEPLLQLDKIKYFIQKTQRFVDGYTIITNGYLVDECKEQLLELRKLHSGFTLNVSFDFVLQDENRQKNSYDVVKKNIKWLYDNNLCNRVITTFSYSNVYRINEVYDDFKTLQKDCPDIKCMFNIDRYGNNIIDEERLKQSLSKIKVKDTHFSYNNSAYTKRATLPEPDCFYCMCFIALCDDGSLYPGYEFLYENDNAKKLFYIGHIEEPFDVIQRKQKELVTKLSIDPKQECIECTAPCKVFPWTVVKDDLSQCWDIPEGDHCKLHKLLENYLYNENKV